MADNMRLDSFKKYIENYEGLNRLWRIEHHINNGNIYSEKMAVMHHEYAKKLKLYKKSEMYVGYIGVMNEEGTFRNERDDFENQKKEIERKQNHAKSMFLNDDQQFYYSALGDLYLTIGDTTNSITQYRYAQSHITRKTSTSLIPSLKKMQLYLNEEEELKVEVNINKDIHKNRHEIDPNDYDRFHIACLIVAMRLQKYDSVLEQTQHIDLVNDVAITEFTSEKDLAFYLTVCQIQLKDYSHICGSDSKYNSKSINAIIALDTISQNCINSIKRNDFKNCIKYQKQIFEHMEMDSVVGLRVQEIKDKCYTSVICMYLEAFNYIKFETQSADLEIDQKKILSYLDTEIRRNEHFNFQINKVEGYVERRFHDVDYVDLYKKALNTMKHYNMSMLRKVLEQQFFQNSDRNHTLNELNNGGEIESMMDNEQVDQILNANLNTGKGKHGLGSGSGRYQKGR